MAAKKPSGLGRGLGALLGDEALKNDSGGVLTVPISQVENCSSQPRKAFDPEALEELAESIRQHGILQPLTVRRLQSGYYQIIAGERRWRAARLAGLTEVPVLVIEADDRKAAELVTPGPSCPCPRSSRRPPPRPCSPGPSPSGRRRPW